MSYNLKKKKKKTTNNMQSTDNRAAKYQSQAACFILPSLNHAIIVLSWLICVHYDHACTSLCTLTDVSAGSANLR